MRRGLVALLCLWPAAAFAREAPQPPKLAALAAKQGASAVETTAARAKYDAELQKRIGKPPEVIVNLHNIWTYETLVLDAKKGSVVDDQTFDRFLRCHFTNEPTQMDPRLLGVLVGAAVRFKTDRIDIVSGFRSPKFNLMLRKHGHEVARDSQHTYGHAVDFRIPGVPTTRLLGFVKGLRLGGAGFYPESEFVHADTGPVRYWTGR